MIVIVPFAGQTSGNRDQQAVSTVPNVTDKLDKASSTNSSNKALGINHPTYNNRLSVIEGVNSSNEKYLREDNNFSGGASLRKEMITVMGHTPQIVVVVQRGITKEEREEERVKIAGINGDIANGNEKR